MNVSENAEVVLRKRYYLENETWDDLCHRVANFISNNAKDREAYFDAMNNFKFMPNSPTLMNAGTQLPNLSACFVLPLSDNMESIMDTAKEMAIVFKSGGGVGIDLSNLRENGSSVQKTNGAASGVVSFMELYNTVANVVKQGGRRRAALMGSLRVDHPEILDFIDCKLNPAKLNNFNISVAITDKFMKAVHDNKDYNLVSPVNGVVGKLNAREVFVKIATNAHANGEPGILFVDTANRYNPVPQFGSLKTTNPCVTGDTKILTSNGNIEISKLVGKKVSIWNGNEWSCVIPKVTGHNKEILDIEFDNGTTLSCTEEHVLILRTKNSRYIDCPARRAYVGDICKSISVAVLDSGDKMVSTNYETMIVSIKKRSQLEETVYCVTEPKRSSCVLNNILTKNCGEIYLLPDEACNLLSLNLDKIEDNELEYHVRLAVRFLNDVIDAGKFPLQSIYDGVRKTRKIGLGIMGWADFLAKRMIPYDSPKARNLAESLESRIASIAHDESRRLAIDSGIFIDTNYGQRKNGTLLTIAPTGTISMICDCSSGIEPYFALAYTKTVMDGHSLKYINEILKSKLKELGLWSPEVRAAIIKTGSIQNINCIPEDIKSVFKTANEISVGGHVKMQAAFQKYVDNSISKTINLPMEATVEDVLHAYGLAYDLGCKGITVYRDGSRSGQVLSTSKSKIEKCPECNSKLNHSEGCSTCVSCGWSACST